MLNNTSSSVIFFLLNTLKGIVKTPAVDLMRLNTIRDTKTAFLNPKRYHGHFRPFIWEPPSPPPTYPHLGISTLSQLTLERFVYLLGEVPDSYYFVSYHSSVGRYIPYS